MARGKRNKRRAADPPYPKGCSKCNLEVVHIDHWRRVRDRQIAAGFRWCCHKEAEVQDYKKIMSRGEEIIKDVLLNVESTDKKLKSLWYNYRNTDIKMGWEDTLSFEEARLIMNKKCYYCDTVQAQRGLDRYNNLLGHTLDNVLPSCSTCNYILSDMPQMAKHIFTMALYTARVTGAYGDWIPPVLRNRKVQNDIQF